MAQNRRKKISRRMTQKRRRRMRILFGLAVLCAIVLTGASYLVLYRYVSKVPEHKICDNIYIGNVNVSGLTKKEARELMKEHLQEDMALKITMKVGDRSAEATLEELGLSYKDIGKVVDKAAGYGKKGRLFTRYRQIKGLKKEKLVLGEGFVLDAEKTKAVIDERVEGLADHAVDASIAKSGDGFEIIKEKKGKTVDEKASEEMIVDYLNDRWDHKGFKVKMAVKTEEPSIKAKDLESIKDELGSFSTDAGGGERWKNLKTGVDKINGTILMPGDELSVHDTTAPYDAEHGYVEAGSYENGQVVDSFGGGICQVSTTLYNAVLYSELEVLERYPHSMLVAYVDPSRDAAIAGDYLDLKFKNSYETPVYIAAEIDSANQMRFTIYGKDTRAEGRTVEYESETLTTEDYGVTYKENKEAELGSVQYAGSPHTGKTARLWKVVYQDGAEVSRDIINNSTYEKSDQIIEVGTLTDNAQAAELVRKAISSQDKAAIDAAIAEAKGLSAGESNGE